MRFKKADITRDLKGGYIVSIHLSELPQDVLKKLQNDKIKTLEIKYGKKRSLDANSALWVMLDKMARVLKTSKEELYKEVLVKYGVSEFMAVPQKAVDKMKQQFRVVIERGTRKIGNKELIVLECYFGTSTYNTEEFSHLLDMVIEDAKELGVEFISYEERTRLLEQHRKDNENE